MHIDLMLRSLDGLSVGDALGAEFPIMGRSIPDLRASNLPARRWGWTDDTEMACTVVAELSSHGGIDQDRLAAAFAQRFDPNRDYGFLAVDTLRQIRNGVHWREAAGAVFDHQGSCGNGAAMRVAPLGAFYAGDPEKIAAEAVRSAQVTHLHPEGVLGAVAVALAAGQAAHARLIRSRPTSWEFITGVLDRLADGDTSRLIRHARTLLGASAKEAADELGNGSLVTAQNTVPFTIWVAATHLDDYPAAITTCIAADGDIDTTSAIVGGIVAAYTGTSSAHPIVGVPQTWLAAREPLPDWFNPSRRTRRRQNSASSRVRRWLSSAS
ncbi:ADP-ribosylglycohydrolase family protein [Nocardia gipuzkoensis]|uniref:ADP-ribosylglycohydrolase family protein n=1 Tax=Nocardia gipuzkoensis TaxID=2749991 RepID=UPI001E3EE718|nr:ADP-ribosylglycohydrolase family protein [Nocardia gipuzkoensis]UGT66999.1 ADP-ribosylglycohydrolase family protein [Nocardia gipuzkoensis]